MTISTSARACRQAQPSRSGNLQAFGAHFADYVESLPACRDLPYLGDVARLEWLRQQCALAADGKPKSAGPVESSTTTTFQPQVRLLASRHAVLTIWRYAMQPGDARLQLPEAGECVVLWRDGNEVAMAELDPASFACIEALAAGATPAEADAAARACNAGFDFAACFANFSAHGLIAATKQAASSCRP